MSMYTTGEIARLCGVSVRTVQYYDTRGILIPSELSEGGRRLYTEADVKKLRIICFLRDAGISIGGIGDLFREEEPGPVIEVLMNEQEETLRAEIDERQKKLGRLDGIRREMKGISNFSVESIGDIAYLMENKKKVKRVHAVLLISGIPMCIVQWAGVFLWIFTGAWWLFVAYYLMSIPYGIFISRYYYRHVAYICPQCHEVFIPSFREMFWARHTPSLRKLTCVKCGYRGFCVETCGKEEKNG